MVACRGRIQAARRVQHQQAFDKVQRPRQYVVLEPVSQVIPVSAWAELVPVWKQRHALRYNRSRLQNQSDIFLFF